MYKIICQALIHRPKLLLIMGVILMLLGLSRLSGGPIYVAYAQGTPCPDAPTIAEEPKLTGMADFNKAVGNPNSLGFKLKCNYPGQTDPVEIWKIILGATDILVALYLIAIAVMTIFHIQYDTYSIKKTLPPLVVGIILANFSLLIARFLVDFANVLTVTFINAAGGRGQFLEALIRGMFKDGAAGFGNFLGDPQAGTAGVVGKGGAIGVLLLAIPFIGLASGWGILVLGIVIIGLIAVFIPALAILFMGVLLFARYYVILALAIVSPLAFITMAFPGTQKYFQKWWSEMLKWTFMMPVMFFLLWLAIQFGKLSGSQATFTTYFITLVLMYLAIKVPFSWSTLAGFAVGAGVVGAGKTLAQKGWGSVKVGAGAIAQKSQLARKEYSKEAKKIKNEWGFTDEASKNRIKSGLRSQADYLRTEANRLEQHGMATGSTRAIQEATLRRRQADDIDVQTRQLDEAYGRSQNLEKREAKHRRASEVMGLAFVPEGFVRRFATNKAIALRAGTKTERFGWAAGRLAQIEAGEERSKDLMHLDIRSVLEDARENLVKLKEAGMWSEDDQAGFFRLLHDAIYESRDYRDAYFSQADIAAINIGDLRNQALAIMSFYRRKIDREDIINGLNTQLGANFTAARPYAAMDNDEQSAEISQVVDGVPNNAAVVEQMVQAARKSTGLPNTIVVGNADVSVNQMAMPGALDIALRRMFASQQKLMQALQSAQAGGNPQEVVNNIINNQIDNNVKNDTPLNVEQIAQQTGINDPASIRATLQDYDAERRAAMGLATGLGVEKANFEQQYDALSGRLAGQLERGELNLQDLENFRDQAQGALVPPSQT